MDSQTRKPSTPKTQERPGARTAAAKPSALGLSALALAASLGFSFAAVAAPSPSSPAASAASRIVIGAFGLGGVDAARSAVAGVAGAEPAALSAAASVASMFDWKSTVPRSVGSNTFGGVLVCAWTAPVVPIHWLTPAAEAAGFKDPAAAALLFVARHEAAHCRSESSRPLAGDPDREAKSLREEAAADLIAAAAVLKELPGADPAAFGRALFVGRLADWLSTAPGHAPSKALLRPLEASAAAPISATPEGAAMKKAYAEGGLPPAGIDAALGLSEGTVASAFAAGRAGPPKDDAWVDRWFEARRAAKRAEVSRRADLVKAAASDPEAAFRLGAEMIAADAVQSLKAGNESEALAALARGRELMRSSGSPERVRAVETAYHIVAAGLSKDGVVPGADPKMRAAFLRTWCAEGSAESGPVRSLEGLAAQRLGAKSGECQVMTSATATPARSGS